MIARRFVGALVICSAGCFDWSQFFGNPPDAEQGDMALVDLSAADLATPEDRAQQDLPEPDLLGGDQGRDLTSRDFRPVDLAPADLAGDAFTTCAGGRLCGPWSSDDCCLSTLVPGGFFYRAYDGINYTSQSFPATVTAFRLDVYEVTVGRFRAWVNAGFPRPSQGAGARTLNGLSNQGGWDVGWNQSVASSTGVFECNLSYQTWTDSPAANENLPMNCVSWFDAFAFCVWDGGYLPTHAEWNYAAAGGAEQRAYPWSIAYPPGSTTIDGSHAVYGGAGLSTVGSRSSKGDGKWGQADLAGNVWEWLRDYYSAALPNPCTDCAQLAVVGSPVVAGGGFFNVPNVLYVSYLSYRFPDSRVADVGLRCARSP